MITLVMLLNRLRRFFILLVLNKASCKSCVHIFFHYYILNPVILLVRIRLQAHELRSNAKCWAKTKGVLITKELLGRHLLTDEVRNFLFSKLPIIVAIFAKIVIIYFLATTIIVILQLLL
jgi:hypothetical protein